MKTPYPSLSRDVLLSSITILFVLLLTITFVSAFILTGPSVAAGPFDEDPDNDGYGGQFSRPGEEILTTGEEYENGTNPFDWDSDDDLMSDGWEIRWDLDPNDDSDAEADYDGDGFTNLEEFNDDTNPRDVDLDRDGMPDVWEENNGLDPTNASDALEDPDGDGLNNYQEFLNKTLPFDEDTDDDGMPDGWEVENLLNPIDPNDAPPDSDNGGVSNIGEYYNSTDPWNGTDDYGNAGGGNGGEGVPDGDGVPPDTGRTDTEVTLINVFDPPLGSLKRWQVLDGLGSNYLMYIRNTTTTALPLSGGDHDHIFHGALNVTLTEEVFYRIPHPSPDSVLLNFHFANASVQFFKDPADNYYVLVPEDDDPGNTSTYSNTLYFTFGTDGEYFTLDIDPTLTTLDMPNEPADLLPNITSNIRQSVQWFLDNAGDPGVQALDGETNLHLIVTNLTSYFSNFTAGDGDVPDPTGGQDIYQAIAINEVGACRHRAFAFFVTANALGVPTRYVANEVHCFVEVYIPDGAYSDSNWHRIDLGGAGSIEDENPRPPEPPGTNETVIRLGPVQPVVYMGVPFPITGNISTLNGTPLPYNPFSVLSDGVQVGSGSTDSRGNISLNITLMDIGIGQNNLSLRSWPFTFYLANNSGNRSYELYTGVYLNPTWPMDPDDQRGGGGGSGDDLTFRIGRNMTLFVPGYLSTVNGTILTNESVRLLWNGSNVDPVTTTDQGEYNLSHLIGPAETPGDHELIVRFLGHGYYLQENVSITVNVTTSTLELTARVEPVSQDASADISVIGHVEDGAGGNLSGRGNLLIILHGVVLVNAPVSTLTDAGGEDFNITVTIPGTLTRGDYILFVAFVPDEGEDLPTATVNLDLHVDKITSVIYLYPGIIEIQEFHIINGTLFTGNGSPVPGQVDLYWKGSYLTTVTVDENGAFSFRDYLDTGQEIPGPLEITAMFNGTATFIGSSISVNYSVISDTNIVMFTVDPPTGLITRNQTLTFIGRVLDENGQWIQNQTVYLSISDGVHWNRISNTTINGTSFELEYHLSPDLIPGPLELRFDFPGTEYYLSSLEHLSYEVHAHTFINAVNVTDPVQAGTNFTIDGTFIDDMGHPLELPLIITFLGQQYTPIIENGTYMWEHPIPISQESGDFDLLISFLGINNFDGASLTLNITIYHLTNFTLYPANLTRGTVGIFNGIIRDELGNGVPNLTIDIYLRGSFLRSRSTNADGDFFTSILLDDDLPLGPALVEIVFTGTDHYFRAEANYTTNIFATTSIELVEIEYATRDQLVFSGTLTDNLGNVLTDRNITLLFNDDRIGTITDANGSFIHNYTSNITLGFYTLQSEFDGQGYYLASSNVETLRVVSYLNITVTYMSDPVAGRGFIVSGTVRDDQDHPVTAELFMTLASSNNNTRFFPVATNGLFNTTWTLDPGLIPGWYSFYINNSNPYPATHYLDSSISTIVFLRRATAINATIPEAVRGEDVIITGELFDAANFTIPNAEVRLIFGNTTLIEQTDGMGNFIFVLSVEGDHAPGIHPITIEYPGNVTLLSSRLDAGLMILVPTIIILEPADMHVQSVVITGHVEDNLGGPVVGYVDLFFDGRFVGNVYSSPTSGFRLPLIPKKNIGVFEVRAEYDRYTPFLASAATTNYTLYTWILMIIDINSTITDTMPPEFQLEHPVLAGEYFNLTLNVTTDLGIEPTELDLRFDFMGRENHTNLSDSRTQFYVSRDLVPYEDNVLRVYDMARDPFFRLYPDPTEITINVVQPTRIQVNQNQDSGDLTINGFIWDRSIDGRLVNSGEINVTRVGVPLNVTLEEGEFTYREDVSERWGPENYTFIYPTNAHYLGSTLNRTIQIRARTILTLDVQESAYFGEEFSGTVQLTYPNGDPISKGVLFIQLGDEPITASTNSKGKYTFTTIMDTNHSMVISVEFHGDENFYGNSTLWEVKIGEKDDPVFSLSDLLTARALVIYIIVVAIGMYVWRRKQFKYLMSLMHDSALRLDAGENPRSVVFIAYNLMCRHLRRFNLVRGDHETVSEFKGTAQRRMRLSEDGVGSLTQMMEYADYSDHDTSENHKENAVRSLRSVERELAGLNAPRRRKGR